MFSLKISNKKLLLVDYSYIEIPLHLIEQGHHLGVNDECYVLKWNMANGRFHSMFHYV